MILKGTLPWIWLLLLTVQSPSLCNTHLKYHSESVNILWFKHVVNAVVSDSGSPHNSYHSPVLSQILPGNCPQPKEPLYFLPWNSSQSGLDKIEPSWPTPLPEARSTWKVLPSSSAPGRIAPHFSFSLFSILFPPLSHRCWAPQHLPTNHGAQISISDSVSQGNSPQSALGTRLEEQAC